MSGIFNCGCCGELFPEVHRNIHHKIPDAAEGPDSKDNLIELCPGCHDALHNLAYKLMSRTASNAQAYDQLNIIFKQNRKAIDICIDLAHKVRDAMINKREKGIQDPTYPVQLNTVLQHQHKELLALVCKDMKISQDAFVRSIILKELQQITGKKLSFVKPVKKR